MRIYIAGPMHGLPDHNYPAFKTVAELLRAGGRDVVSPTDRVNHIPPEPGPEYAIGMLKDSIKDMLGCDEMYLLDGWSESRGVALELLLAVLFQYPIRKLVLTETGFALMPTKFSLVDTVKHFVRVWKIPQT